MPKVVTNLIIILLFHPISLLADNPNCKNITEIVKSTNVNDDIEIKDIIDFNKVDLNLILKDCMDQKVKHKSGIYDYVISYIYFEKDNLAMHENYLISAIENGYDAYDEVILLYMYGYESNEYSIEVNPDKFLKFAKEGAKKSSPMALYRLGYAYKYGEIVKQDFEIAKKYLERSAELGVINSKLELLTLQSDNYFETLLELEMLMVSNELDELQTTLTLEFILWHASQYAAAVHDYEKSIDYALQIIDLLTERKGPTYENLAYDYMILADVYNLSGKFSEALKAIDEALEIHSFSYAAVDSYLMQIFTRKALILDNLNRKAEAFSIYKKIDDYYSNDPLDYFLADHNRVQYKIAEHYLSNNDLINARAYINQINKKNTEDSYVIRDNNLPIITKVLFAEKNIKELDIIVEKNLNERKLSSIYSYAEALKIFSENYYLHYDASKCVQLLEESLDIKEKQLNSNNINLIETKYALSMCYKKNGNEKKANRLIVEISKIYIENEKVNTFDLNNLFLKVFYNNLLLFNKNPKTPASDIFKLVKLMDSVNNHSSIEDLFIRDYIDDINIKNVLLKKESLKNQIEGIENELFKIRTSFKIDRELEKKYIEELELNKINLQEINITIDQNYPQLNFLINEIDIDIEKLSLLISDREKILIYTSFENNLIILLLDNNGYEFTIIKDRYNEIINNIEKFRIILQDPFSNTDSFKIANIIYNDLIKPVEHRLKEKDKLIIINDEEISALPFASLTEKDPKTENFDEIKWLLKKYNFNYLPSIDSYYLLKTIKDRKYENKFFGIGNPDFNGAFEQLPNTADEIYKISSIFNEDKRKILLGQMADEKIVKESKINSKFLMFATHAITAHEILGINEPAIILSIDPNSAEDGYLTSTEIINKEFISDLLILSACNTAKPDSSGKYFSGLMRSFLYSGSRNLLSTLWSIETMSAEALTTSFFDNDVSKYSESLRNSQISLIESENYSHPFFWSPYIIVGVN